MKDTIIGAPVALKERNITDEKIEEMSKNALLRGPIGTLLQLNSNDVYEILKLAL